MNLRTQSKPLAGVSLSLPQWPLSALLLALLCAATARGQDMQEAVGTVAGTDVSISSASGGPRANVVQNDPAAPVANGSIVTVHSGQARLMLTSGGEVDICGP